MKPKTTNYHNTMPIGLVAVKDYLASIMDGGPVAHAPHQRPHEQCAEHECLGAHWSLLRKDNYGTRIGIAL